jgi:hypothetical protein
VRVEVGVGVKSAFRSSAIRPRSSRLILGKCFRCYAIASRQEATYVVLSGNKVTIAQNYMLKCTPAQRKF